MVSSIKPAEEVSSAGTIFDNNLIWLNTKEAARFLRRSVGQIRNMVWRGQLKARKFRGRLLFEKWALQTLVENSTY
jgi:hypothetical protein